MKILMIILACTTFCHKPVFKVGDCTNDKEDKINPTYRKIIRIGTDDYTFQIANNPDDIARQLLSSGDIEVFDRRNIKVTCPNWLDK